MQYYSLLLNDDSDMKIFSACMALESLYSLSQCNKILNHMNLTIDDLTIPNKIYTNFKEHSNVFSYYVITSFLINKM